MCVECAALARRLVSLAGVECAALARRLVSLAHVEGAALARHSPLPNVSVEENPEPLVHCLLLENRVLVFCQSLSSVCRSTIGPTTPLTRSYHDHSHYYHVSDDTTGLLSTCRLFERDNTVIPGAPVGISLTFYETKQ